MSFYKEISPFVEFVFSIRKLEDYLSFDMVFPNKWNLPKSLIEENQIVSFDTKSENTKGISFVSKIDETEVSRTLVKIGKVIKLNREREIKEKLFKQTVEQLKQTFEKNDLEKLKGLYFDFETEEETKLELDVNTTTESEDVELA